MYDGRKIANLLLTEFDPKQFEISNLKLNKVLFFVHAFHLVRHSTPLIKNHFEAWDHGPVVRVVYHEFKVFGGRPITQLASHLNYESGKVEVIRFSDVEPSKYAFIKDVAGHYMSFSALQLRDLTHEPGGPWHQVFNSAPENRGIGDRIPNELIGTHFAKQIGRQRSLN